MKSVKLSLLKCIAVFALCLTVVGVEAKSYRVRDVQNVQLRDSRRFVANPDGLLSQSAVERLDSICYALKASGIAEVAIVAVDDISPRDMFSFSQELFTQWGVGDEELDNGLGILLVGDMCEIRFHTGYGLEGVLPDVLCYRIQQDYMVPYFREGNYSEGMVEGMLAVDSVLQGGELPKAKAKENEDAKITALFIVLMLCIPVLMIVAQSRKNTRCPQCGRHTLRPVRRQTVQLSATETLVTTILKCDNCGSEHTRTENQNNHRGGGGGIWIMPMGGFGGGRGGFGGGGFGGGGFGGGSFGGGGSGSRW